MIVYNKVVFAPFYFAKIGNCYSKISLTFVFVLNHIPDDLS